MVFGWDSLIRLHVTAPADHEAIWHLARNIASIILLFISLSTRLESFGQTLRKTGLDMCLENIFNPPIQEEPAGIVRPMGSHFNGAREDRKITDGQHDVELL